MGDGSEELGLCHYVKPIYFLMSPLRGFMSWSYMFCYNNTSLSGLKTRAGNAIGLSYFPCNPTLTFLSRLIRLVTIIPAIQIKIPKGCH